MAETTRITEINQQNIAKVMHFIYRKVNASRIEIATALNFKPATVTSLVNYLISENKIFETGHEIRKIKGSGRSRKLLTINKNFGYVIGIEFNMRGIAILATDLMGGDLYHHFIKLSKFPIENITEIILTKISVCLHHLGEENCKGIGFAVPGHYKEDENLIFSNNKLWCFFNFNKIKKTLNFPIFIENNIECMALDEYLFEAQHSPENFLFLHIGPGIFSSFFDGNQIKTKDNFYIGEIGHSVVDIHGQNCECGKRGCLQTYISDTWLIDSAKYLFHTSQNTILKNIVNSADEIDLNTIISAYHLGDTYIIDKIEAGLLFLSISISNTLIIYDAHKIFINSELINRLNLTKKLTRLITEQLKFIRSNNELDVEILDFNIYRGAKGACALSIYHSVISYPN